MIFHQRKVEVWIQYNIIISSPNIFTFWGTLDIWMKIIEISFYQNCVGTETFWMRYPYTIEIYIKVFQLVSDFYQSPYSCFTVQSSTPVECSIGYWLSVVVIKKALIISIYIQNSTKPLLVNVWKQLFRVLYIQSQTH